ncbi:MAG: glycyl-radical enzyme activating protein [Lentisphaeria bacterium]|jgi:pyruvate formate lyase activating enzyme|nr:glycyl-radical enzyme activating protein [Lentisphaeria bacterium]
MIKTMAEQGTIFEVKRFAVHDGPGVRTTLFLKGCPLRCRWCHNPEGMDSRPVLAYHEQKCLHCGECVGACPQGAHSLVGGRHVLERAKCIACGQCVEACLGRALRLYGRDISVGEARDLVLEDRDFYREGGGVTVSGGEPLLQADFCAALFSVLKRDGIGCAVDTSGAVPWESFAKVLPGTDIVLYDVKHVDEARHREWVGVSNERILGNLRKLSGRGVPIEVRIPLIPGFNLDGESLTGIGRFLADLGNLVGVRLLPYHPAQSKYESVGRPDPMEDAEIPTAGQVQMASGIMVGCGIRIL